MEIKGKLVAKLPVTTYGKEGKKKGGFVIEYGDRYPKNVAFTVFEQKLSSISSLKIGDTVSVDCRPESREWQGKWFTDVIADAISVISNSGLKEEPFQVPDQYSDLPF